MNYIACTCTHTHIHTHTHTPVHTLIILLLQQMQIEAESGFPEWSNATSITVPILPETGGGTYTHTLSDLPIYIFLNALDRLTISGTPSVYTM